MLALALALASYHDSYYHGTIVASTFGTRVPRSTRVLVSSAEALENPENLCTQIRHRSSSGPFSDVTWLLAISLAKLRYSALRVALVRFAALFVNPKCRITQLGKQSTSTMVPMVTRVPWNYTCTYTYHGTRVPGTINTVGTLEYCTIGTRVRTVVATVPLTLIKVFTHTNRNFCVVCLS